MKRWSPRRAFWQNMAWWFVGGFALCALYLQYKGMSWQSADGLENCLLMGGLALLVGGFVLSKAKPKRADD